MNFLFVRLKTSIIWIDLIEFYSYRVYTRTVKSFVLGNQSTFFLLTLTYIPSLEIRIKVVLQLLAQELGKKCRERFAIEREGNQLSWRKKKPPSEIKSFFEYNLLEIFFSSSRVCVYTSFIGLKVECQSNILRDFHKNSNVPNNTHNWLCAQRKNFN